MTRPDVPVSSSMSFDRRAEWDRPAVRVQKLKIMRHSLMYSALEKGLGLVTEPFVEASGDAPRAGRLPGGADGGRDLVRPRPPPRAR